MKKFLWGTIALVLISNGFVLARVVYNRQGGEPTTLVLTERELRLPWRYRDQNEDSGIRLELNWSVFLPPQDCSNELYTSRYNRSLPLTPQLAQQLNFKIPTKADWDEDSPFYRHSTRQVWLALEMEGKAYQGYLQYLEEQITTAQGTSPRCIPTPQNGPDGARASESAPDCVPAPEEIERQLSSKRERLHDAQVKESRLFVVDMASSRKTLETRYADQPNVAIVPGLVRISASKDQSYTVYVNSVMPRKIHIPLEFRQQVVDLEPGYVRKDKSDMPRYEAKVAFGKLGEPWIQTLTAIK